MGLPDLTTSRVNDYRSPLVKNSWEGGEKRTASAIQAKSDVYIPPTKNASRGKSVTARDFVLRLGRHSLKLHAQIYLPERRHEKSQTFVLVHGFQSNRANFAKMALILQKEGHAVYALDLPGHGKSDRPEWFNYSDPDAYVEAMKLFLEKAKLQDVHLVGHSMGAGLSTYLSLKYPERISRLTLVSPWSDDILISSFGKNAVGSLVTRFFLWLNPTLNMKRGLRNTSEDRDWTRDNKIMADLTAPIDVDSEKTFPGLLQDTLEMDWSKLQRALTPKNISRLRQHLKEIQIFYGAEDTLIPEGQVEDLANKLGVEVIKVENVGHVLPLEAPEVASFISGSRRAENIIFHERSDGPEALTDIYHGPYFQWGLRGGFQTNLSGNEMTLPSQVFFNLDPDHPHPLQLGLEFGLQLNTPIKNTPWTGSAFVQPKFYWYRNTWLELTSSLTPSGGLGDFSGAESPWFYSLDGSPLRTEIILLNPGFIISLFTSLDINLHHSQNSDPWKFTDRASGRLGVTISQ